jgi:hypothetical protein
LGKITINAVMVGYPRESSYLPRHNEIEIMTNLISENKSQIMDATAECENGNQNKQNIIDQLKDSFIEFKIG